MRTITFSTKLNLVDGKPQHSGKFDLPDPEDVFDPDAWRASDVFDPSATDDEIARELVDAIARDAKINVYQRPIRDQARSVEDAERIMRGARYGGGLDVWEVPADLYDTFTEAQLEAFEKEGKLVVPKA